MAQSDTVYRHLPVTREGVPLFIINGHIIMNVNDINPNDITAINILEDSNIPANFKNLSQYGVVTVTLKKTIKTQTKSLREIKEWLDIKADTKFAVDGFFIDDKNLMVATPSLTEINILKNNDLSGHLKDVVINIWTLNPANRRYVPGKRLSTDKPGVIYIR